jgi:uncharacterized protein (DUF433 family)
MNALSFAAVCATVLPALSIVHQGAAAEQVSGKVSGTWVFKNTRVQVRALFENIEDGATVNDILAWFPGVTREQAEAVLEHAERSLAAA